MFGNTLSRVISERLVRQEREPGLRMSSIGQPCERKFWNDYNIPTEGIPLRPEHYLKFLYGDILEELILFLAKKAGHKVEGEQDELTIGDIKGHRDAIIDGITVDVKSASKFSHQKFREGLKKETDGFGYLNQLKSYVYAGKDDPRVLEKNVGAFLVVDKERGHLHLDIHKFDFTGLEDFYKHRINIANNQEPPPRSFEPEPFQSSGNLKLGFNCSYCPYNKLCFPEQRTFLYANGPVTLTKVIREPLVPELK